MEEKRRKLMAPKLFDIWCTLSEGKSVEKESVLRSLLLFNYFFPSILFCQQISAQRIHFCSIKGVSRLFVSPEVNSSLARQLLLRKQQTLFTFQIRRKPTFDKIIL